MAGAGQPSGDHGVVRQIAPDPRAGAWRRTLSAGVFAARSAPRPPAAWPTRSSSSRASPGAPSIPAGAPNRAHAAPAGWRPPWSRSKLAPQAPLAKRRHRVLAPRDLQVAVDLDPVERRLGEGVESLVEGEGLPPRRVAPVVRDQQRGAPAATGPAAPAANHGPGIPTADEARPARSSRHRRPPLPRSSPGCSPGGSVGSLVPDSLQAHSVTVGKQIVAKAKAVGRANQGA